LSLNVLDEMLTTEGGIVASDLNRCPAAADPASHGSAAGDDGAKFNYVGLFESIGREKQFISSNDEHGLRNDRHLLEKLPDRQRSLDFFLTTRMTEKHFHDSTEKAATTIVRIMPTTTTMTTARTNL
jgi:hypothetical protein